MTLTFSGNLSITDPDAASGPIQVSLTVTNGRLTLSTTPGLTFTLGDGTLDPAMTFTGTLTAINAALNGMTYLGNNNFNGCRFAGHPDQRPGQHRHRRTADRHRHRRHHGQRRERRAGQHRPRRSVADEDMSKVFNAASGNLISVTDVEAATVQVALSVANGTLTLSQTTGLTFGGGANGTGSMTFTGLLSNVNAALNGLSYLTNQNFSGSDTLTIVTSDLGTTRAPGLLDTDTVAINVNAVNDAPQSTRCPVLRAPTKAPTWSSPPATAT